MGLFDEIIESEIQNKQLFHDTEETIYKNPVAEGDDLVAYENVPDLSVLMVSLEDIHTAVYNFFDKKYPIFDSTGNKVPVVYAGSSRWAITKRLLKQNSEIPDSNKLKLPIISIISKGTELDRSRWYPTSKNHETSYKAGTLIKGDLNDIRDIYISPPQPFICTYEIAVWVNTNVEMDRVVFKQIADALSDFTVEIRNFRFVGFLESISDENNFNDYGSDEVIIRKRFNIKINGYIINEKNISLVNRIITYETKLSFNTNEELIQDVSILDKKYKE